MQKECFNCKHCLTLRERSRNQTQTIKILREELAKKNELLLALATKFNAMPTNNLSMIIGDRNEKNYLS